MFTPTGMQRGSLRLVVVGMFTLTGSPVCGSARSATWQCTTLDRKSLAPSTAVVWERLNCSGTALSHAVGPMAFNLVTVQLADPGVNLVPVAASDHTLNTVPGLVGPKAVAAINGGYFWRVDETSLWVDDVCIGKSRVEALRNASIDDADAGVGDSLLVADGRLLASNCDRPDAGAARGGRHRA